VSLSDTDRERLREKLKSFREGKPVSGVDTGPQVSQSGPPDPMDRSRRRHAARDLFTRFSERLPALPLPAMLAVAIILFAGTLSTAIYAVNYLQLQSHLNKVVEQDSRNGGIKVSVHFANYVSPSTLVYDLRSLSGNKAMADVFRVFLQFAHKMREKDFAEVQLAFQGTVKFKIRGAYFKQLGTEYSHQNPVYTSRTFPENVMNLDGSSAYPTWTGGLFGVAQRQMEDFGDFHQKWYLRDMVK
jgi:hypothetical protein